MRKAVVLILAGVLLLVFAAPSIALPRVVLQADLQPWIAATAMPAIAAHLGFYELPQMHASEMHFALGSARFCGAHLLALFSFNPEVRLNQTFEPLELNDDAGRDKTD
jgi:hypothetical protein